MGLDRLGLVRALVPLTAASALRFAREGLVVRALLWPGLLASGALVGSAAAVAWLSSAPEIGVPLDQPEVTARLEHAGFTVIPVEDPAAALASGALDRAAWPTETGWALAAGPATTLALRAEGAIRDGSSAPWTVVVPAPPARPPDAGLAAGAMAGLLGVLFALYGVVLGAGALVRDRDAGVWESDLSLPLPFYAHAAARMLAASAVMGAALGSTLLLLHGLVGLPDVGAWAWHGFFASAAGAVLGTGALGARGEGFSGPLSRALTASLGLAGLGLIRPEIGAWLPISSLLAMWRGASGPASGAVMAALTVALGAAAAWRVGQRGLA